MRCVLDKCPVRLKCSYIFVADDYHSRREHVVRIYCVKHAQMTLYVIGRQAAEKDRELPRQSVVKNWIRAPALWRQFILCRRTSTVYEYDVPCRVLHRRVVTSDDADSASSTTRHQSGLKSAKQVAFLGFRRLGNTNCRNIVGCRLTRPLKHATQVEREYKYSPMYLYRVEGRPEFRVKYKTQI